jgi:hypothetical protein
MSIIPALRGLRQKDHKLEAMKCAYNVWVKVKDNKKQKKKKKVRGQPGLHRETLPQTKQKPTKTLNFCWVPVAHACNPTPEAQSGDPIRRIRV